MYVQQVSFQVVPERFESWEPYARNLLSVMARQSGLVSARLLRSTEDSYAFTSLRTWKSKEAADLAVGAPEIRLAEGPAMAGRFYSGTTEARDFELLDMV